MSKHMTFIHHNNSIQDKHKNQGAVRLCLPLSDKSFGVRGSSGVATAMVQHGFRCSNNPSAEEECMLSMTLG